MNQKQFLPDVSSSYGAPMGRQNRGDVNSTARRSVHLFRMQMIDGDYDVGGAYWGGGTPIYVATDGSDYFATVRAWSLAEAVCKLEIPIENLRG